MRGRARGFSFVELLVVLTTILVIAAIAFLRQVQTAQETYRIANHEYADTFAKLKPYLSTQAALPALPADSLSGILFALASPDPSPGLPPGQGKGQGGTPPGQGGTPPGHGGTPPGQGGTPPGQGGTPPGQGGTPPGQGGSPPGQGGTPPGGTTHTDSMVQSLYIYRLSRPSTLEWQCVVEPLRDRSVARFFYSDNSNIIRYAVGAIPTASSPQI
jgi:hypothetical protein